MLQQDQERVELEGKFKIREQKVTLDKCSSCSIIGGRGEEEEEGGGGRVEVRLLGIVAGDEQEVQGNYIVYQHSLITLRIALEGEVQSTGHGQEGRRERREAAGRGRSGRCCEGVDEQFVVVGQDSHKEIKITKLIKKV
ncbi:MAG: hypothetical protein ACMG6E_06740, partial [Candidatus Roizmanbacteria bacterium]